MPNVRGVLGAPWGILGNNKFGDCGVAGAAHLFMADAAVTGEHESFPTAEEVVQYYLAYTGGRDSGVVLADFLGHVRASGFFGHEVAAYAPVAKRDVTTLRQVVHLYDGCYAGIVVTQAMEMAFARSEPWTTATATGQVIGGHCVIPVGYDEHYVYVVTWGEIQRVTWLGWLAIVEEAWAVITGELVARHGNGRGVDLKALVADLDTLGEIRIA